MYSKDQRIWNAIFHMVAKDLSEAETNGIRVGDELFYPIILGNKGDWSYLVPWESINHILVLNHALFGTIRLSKKSI